MRKPNACRRTILLFSVFLAGCTMVSAQVAAEAIDRELQILQREVSRLAERAGGVVGAAATHIESGRSISHNGTERFPMASTYKVPIAVQLLTKVDRGEVRLAQMIELEAKDLHPGSGILSSLFNKPGVALSVRNLLELMLLISDNSATDICLRLAGGGEAVTARMRDLGIEGINVNRPTAKLIADWYGVPSLPPEDQWSRDLFRKLMRGVTEAERRSAAERFDNDVRDTATPDAMRKLLVRVFGKDLLKSDSAELLLDIMYRCQTGDARLKGILPAGTEVAHKTGTIGGSTNDVGIMTLPNNAGHVAIAVFVKSSERAVSERERTIAEIARAVHDFFLFQPGADH
jgi:beta-lactamase class A